MHRFYRNLRKAFGIFSDSIHTPNHVALDFAHVDMNFTLHSNRTEYHLLHIPSCTS